MNPFSNNTSALSQCARSKAPRIFALIVFPVLVVLLVAWLGYFNETEQGPSQALARQSNPMAESLPSPAGSGTYHAVFARRKDHVAAGLTYTAEFSADLGAWTPGAATPQVITGASSEGDIEVVKIPYPASVPLQAGGNQTPQFFRVGVSSE